MSPNPNRKSKTSAAVAGVLVLLMTTHPAGSFSTRRPPPTKPTTKTSTPFTTTASSSGRGREGGAPLQPLTRRSAGGSPFDAITEALSSIRLPSMPAPPSTPPQSSSSPQGGGRREQFWREVAFGLAERFPSFADVQRVIDYTQYARGESPVPAPDAVVSGHEPCEEYVPGLTAQPYWDAQQFEWARGLEDHAAEIQEELRGVLAAEAGRFAGDSALQTQVMGRGWSALRLQRLGKWNQENCARFPRTTALLKELGVPTAMRGVMFARQLPGTAVARHSDGRNFVLTAHLGLSIPPRKKEEGGDCDCWISVAGERRRWEERSMLVLDTSFHHETANESDEPRDVLIVDFWHPELSPAEVEALQFIYDLRYEFDRAIIEASSAS